MFWSFREFSCQLFVTFLEYMSDLLERSGCGFLQGGPLLVTNGVITPINGLIYG